MAFDPPKTLSPSKVSTFRDCALAFRFTAIEQLPEKPNVASTRGSLVHRALELLFGAPAPERTIAYALTCLNAAFDEYQSNPDFTGLQLDAEREATFLDEAEALVRKYFQLEDPTSIRPIGLELKLEAQVDGVHLRGIIDRLEVDPKGELIVTDYKTGRAPSANQEQARLGGVRFYSLLCEQVFGQRPAAVRLLYLADPVSITHVPTDQSARGLERTVGAVWKAVLHACETEDFRSRPGALCQWCSFHDFCPSFGGDPEAAAVTLSNTPVRLAG